MELAPSATNWLKERRPVPQTGFGKAPSASNWFGKEKRYGKAPGAINQFRRASHIMRSMFKMKEKTTEKIPRSNDKWIFELKKVLQNGNPVQKETHGQRAWNMSFRLVCQTLEEGGHVPRKRVGNSVKRKDNGKRVV